MDTQQIIDHIAQHPLTLTPGAAAGCTHHTITAGEETIACTCNLAPLTTLLEALNALAAQAAEPRTQDAPAPAEPADAAAATLSPGLPTPADLFKHTRPRPAVALGEEPEWELTTTARKSIANLDFTFQQVYDAVAYPVDTSPHPSHATSGLTYYHADPITVLYNDLTNTFVNVYPYDNARVYPGKMRVPGQKAQNRAPLPTTHAGLLTLLREHGFTVTQGGKHLKVTHPDHAAVYTMPSTPSEHRWLLNTVSQIRTVFGIDLRA